MKLLFLSHLFATFAMTGVIWLVQVLTYPAFGQVGPAEFAAYHRHHSNWITLVVGPLMLVELGTAVLLLTSTMPHFPRWLQLIGLGMILAIWFSTAFIQVPDHNRLASGFVEAVHLRLVATNWIRTVLWSLRSGLLIWVLWRMI